MSKLTQMLREQFKKIYLRHKEKRNTQLLDEFLNEIFPNEKTVNLDMKNLSCKDKYAGRVYRREFLPFHTRDNEWLANYVEQVYYRSRSQRVMQIIATGKSKHRYKALDIADITQYVNTSANFDAKRIEYEQRVVKSYLGLFNQDLQDDFYYPSNFKANYWRVGKDLRYGDDVLGAVQYRDLVLRALDFLGINSQVGKVTLEENANLWRNNVWRNETIYKLLHHVMRDMRTEVVPTLDLEKLRAENVSSYYKLKLTENQILSLNKARCEYEYYHASRDISKVVNAVGCTTPGMQMSLQQYQSMGKAIENLEKNYISNYRNCLQINKQIADCGVEQ